MADYIEIELFPELKDTLTDISLVKYPAIESNWLCFAKDFKSYIFSSDEKHIVTGAVLIPEQRIYRRDEYGEYFVYFSADTIRTIVEQYFNSFKNKSFTLEHSDNTNDVTVVESWIKESETDKSVALGIDCPVGTWFISAKVNSDDLWQRIKSGEFNGFSVAGLFNTDTIENQIIREAEELISAKNE